MRINTLIAISILLFIISCKAQDKNKILNGTWETFKTQTFRGKDLVKPIPMVLEFRDGEFIDKTNPDFIRRANYFIKDSIIYFGNNSSIKYKIEKLSNNELVLLDYDEKSPANPMKMRYFFKKI